MDYLFVTLRIQIDLLFVYRRDPPVVTGTTFHVLNLTSSLYQSPSSRLLFHLGLNWPLVLPSLS